MSPHAAARPDSPEEPDEKQPTHGRDGDGAFEALFLGEYGRVVAIARRVAADPEDAADVAQEVFLSAFRAGLDRRPRARGWLYAAAAHIALNHVRAARRRDLRQARHGGPAEASAQGPERAVERLEERRTVRRLLARLPERQAAILVLRHSGLSYAEISASLGLTPGSVGTVLRRAEAAMRREWERYASE